MNQWTWMLIMVLAGLVGNAVATPAPAPQPEPASAAALPADWDPLSPWSIDTQAVRHTLFVAQSDRADDGNPGTADRPLRTIQAAVNLARRHARAGEGTRILIGPGVYRETVDISGRADNAPLIIEARPTGRAVISGSDLFTEWRQVGPGAGVWEHHWPHRFGWVDNPWPGLMPMTTPGLRRELLFIDSRPMRQVFARENLEAGTYFVDEEGGRLLLQTPAGSDPRRRRVEVSVRPTAPTGPHSKLMRLNEVSNVIIRGLVFEHAASMPFSDPALMLRRVNNIIIEDCTMRWNNGEGLSGEGRNVIFRRVVAGDNGTLGMSGSWRNALIEQCQTNRNNWRGMLFGVTGWAPCGFKFAYVDGMILRDHQAIQNGASGGWFDDQNRNVLIERFNGLNNFRSGLSLEANTGPIVVRSSILMGNSVGLNGFDTINVSVEDTLIAANHSKQVRLAGSTPVDPAELQGLPDWRKGRLSQRRPPEHWTFRRTIIGAGAEHQDSLLIEHWMRGGNRDDAGRPPLDRLNRTLRLEQVTFAHPQPERALFPGPDGRPHPWDTWQRSLANPWVRWSDAALRQALDIAQRRTQTAPTGFAGGFAEDNDPGR